MMMVGMGMTLTFVLKHRRVPEHGEVDRVTPRATGDVRDPPGGVSPRKPGGVDVIEYFRSQVMGATRDDYGSK